MSTGADQRGSGLWARVWRARWQLVVIAVSLVVGSLVFLRFFYELTPGAHEVSIEPLDDRRVAFQLERRFGEPVGAWEIAAPPPWASGDGWTSVVTEDAPPATFAGPFGSRLIVRWETGPEGGRARLEVDGAERETVDLFSTEAGVRESVVAFPQSFRAHGLLAVPLLALASYPLVKWAIGVLGPYVARPTRRTVAVALLCLFAGLLVHRLIPVPWLRVVPYTVTISPTGVSNPDAAGTELWVRIRQGDGSLVPPTHWNGNAEWVIRDQWVVSAGEAPISWDGLAGPDAAVEFLTTSFSGIGEVTVNGVEREVDAGPRAADVNPRVRFEVANDTISAARRLLLYGALVIEGVLIAGLLAAVGATLARRGRPPTAPPPSGADGGADDPVAVSV